MTLCSSRLGLLYVILLLKSAVQGRIIGEVVGVVDLTQAPEEVDSRFRVVERIIPTKSVCRVY